MDSDSTPNRSDFKIIRALGSDFKRKFNKVFLCEHKLTGKKVVLKHLTKTQTNSPTQEMLRFESSLEFDSIHFPQTLLVEESEHELFVFKSYLDGIPLDDYWKQLKRKQREAFTLLFLEKLIPLFDELKEKKLIHGDIKPGNILIDGSQLDFEVKLIDFGLSFKYDEPNKRKIIFSLGYSAPELILNELDLANQSSDFFSLGICIWQLFEGKLPLVHPNPVIMTNLQFTHPLPKGDAQSKAISSILSNMCHKESFPKPPNLLNRDEIRTILKRGIENRFQSIPEILEAYKQVPKRRFSLKKLF